MPIEKLRPSFSFDEERIKELKKIAPEAFADGKIYWEALKESLGEHLEDESREVEHFGLFWPGKKEARRIASIPSKGTLGPVYGEGLKTDGTPDSDGINDSHNIFIEGENLEVLKILQKSYAGRIKMIYIDPPYNTGNDFVYDDNFTEPLEEYLKRTGQIDGEGKPLTTNKKADGRFHSKWLSLIYPRLRLARNLLREDGVILVSIDDNEIHNLKSIMNEIFGEENQLGCFIINSTPNARDYGHIGKMHEYCLFYAKNSEFTITHELKEVEKVFKYNDEYGGFNIHPLYNSNEAFTPENRRNLYYPFYLYLNKRIGESFYEIGLEKGENSITIYPPKSEKNQVQFVWRWGKPKSSENLIKEIIGYKTEKGEYRIVQKMRHTSKLIRSILIDKSYTSRRGTAELEELFNGKIFTFPKPLELIKKFVAATTEDHDVILDFFCGSATTAHAVLKLNSEDGGSRKFIMVQLPELLEENSSAYKAGYKNISSISKERLRRAIKNDNLVGGFVAYSLKESNIKQWNYDINKGSEELEKLFDLNESLLINGWTRSSFLSEISLIEGFQLDSQITQNNSFRQNSVQEISSDYHEHKLFVCLDETIKENTINELNLEEKDIFICLDTALSDQDKLNLSDKGLIKTI